MKKIAFYLLFIANLAPSFIYSQTEATTKDGEKVLLYDDGKWDYIKESQIQAVGKKTECPGLIMPYSDKMTGKSYLSTEKSLIVSEDGNVGFSLFCLRAMEEEKITLSIKALGSGCVNQNTKVKMLFRDGSRLEMYGRNKFNCDGNVFLYFNDFASGKKNFKKLKSTPIETIRIQTRKSYIEEDFTEEQSHTLMDILSCIEKK